MTGIEEQQYDRIVATIYKAGLDPAKWQNVVNELGAMFEGVRFAFQGYDLDANDTEIGALIGYDGSFLKTYIEQYAVINPWLEGVSKLPVGQPIDADLFVERQVLESSEFYNDWIKPQEDISYGIVLVLFREDNRSLILSTNIRRIDAELLKPKVQQVLERFAPHLQRAFHMHRTLEGHRIAEHTYLAAIDRVSNAVFLLDEHGRSLHQNTHGEALLRDGSVVYINSGDRLHAVDGTADEALTKSLRAIVMRDYAEVPTSIILRSRNRREPYFATVVPFRPDYDATSILSDLLANRFPTMLLTIMDPTQTRRPPRRILKAMFGLTPAEVDLAIALSHQETLQSFADEHQVSIYTVRNQLKSVFNKTDTHKQSDLVALLGRLTA